MFLEINPQNPHNRQIQQVASLLENDGVMIYPTDTVYGLGCSITSKRAVERILRIKNMDPKKPMTIICSSERQIQEYTQGINSPVFKLMRRVLPGPYTFLFKASKSIPKVLMSKRKTVGVRWPDQPIATDIVEALGHPILSCSLYSDEDRLYEDPHELYETFEKQVDVVIDGGNIYPQHSTIIDFTEEYPVLIREGKGEIDQVLDSESD